MHALELVAVEQYLDGPFEEGDPLEQVEHVDLFEHFLPALEVALHCAPVAAPAFLLEQPVDELRDEVEEVVLLQVGLLLVLLVEYRTEVDLEGVVVVDLDDEEAHGQSAEQPSDVGKDLVQLDVAAFDLSGVGRLEDEEGAVVSVVGTDLEAILDGIFADDAASDLAIIRERRDAVVGGDGVVLHHDLRLLAAGPGEDDVVGVLEVVGEELGNVGVDERVDEVDGEEDLLAAVPEVLINEFVASAVSGVGWVDAGVGALVDRHFNRVLHWRGVLAADLVVDALGQAQPVMHVQIVELSLYSWVSAPVIDSAGFQRVELALVGGLTVVVVLVDEADVEVALALIEVVVPDLHAEHEIYPICARTAEDEGFGIVCIFVGAGGGDAEHVERVEHFVGKGH